MARVRVWAVAGRNGRGAPVGSIEHNLARRQDDGSLAEVHHGRGEQAETGVAMLVVVP